MLALALGLAGAAQAQQYGPSRLRAEGRPFSYPTVAYSQSVVSNVSQAYNNVVNFHWKKGDGQQYVVLVGRYLQRAPYNGTYPTPYPPFAPAPAGPGNGYMDASSRLPSYPAGDEVAPYLLKTGNYATNPADTTAQLLNASPGETYYAYIWEYVVDGSGPRVLPAPPSSNLSWQALFTQFYPVPQITSITRDALNQAVVTWTTAAEDTVAGFRIILADDSTTTNGTLSGAGRQVLQSTVRPTGFSRTVSTYSQSFPVPPSATTWFQIVPYLTPKSSYVPNAPLWSPPQRLVASTPLPVTLTNFAARRPRPNRAAVWVDWATASEVNNAGFELERSLNSLDWRLVVSVAGNGTTTQGHRYAITDSCQAGAYYRLAQHDFSGKVTYSPVRYVAASTAERAVLTLGLFPNPARTRVTLTNVAADEPLQVLNMLGQTVLTLPAGTDSFDASGLTRGIYLVKQQLRQARLLLN